MKFTIKDSTWENYPLWKYIKKELPHYTKVLIIKELRLKNILVNEDKSYFQYKLKLGDLITVKAIKKDFEGTKTPKIGQPNYLTSAEKTSLKEQIIYQNEHLFILNKKAGQFIQPDSTCNTASLQEQIQTLFINTNISSQSKSEKYPPTFIHRLDRAVSGLIIGAKSAHAHSLLSDSLKKGEIEKIYRAIVYGAFPKKHCRLESWILDNQRRVKITPKQEPNSKLAITEIKLLHHFQQYSYLELKLITGRKNQLRAQLASLGFPIIGDRKYLTSKLKESIKPLEFKTNFFNQKKIALLSLRISFSPHLVKELNLSSSSFQLTNNLNFLLNFLNKMPKTKSF